MHAARELIAAHGIDALTMQAVAGRVGVRGPSLYKHFRDRAALLSEIEKTVVADLEKILIAASTSSSDQAAVRAMATAYRQFARESPSTYSLLFALHSDEEATDIARRRALEPAVQRLARWLGDPDLAFVRARVLTAFLHGFVSMEAAGVFRQGGSIEDAFRSGLDLLLSKPEKGQREGPLGLG